MFAMLIFSSAADILNSISNEKIVEKLSEKSNIYFTDCYEKKKKVKVYFFYVLFVISKVNTLMSKI